MDCISRYDSNRPAGGSHDWPADLRYSDNQPASEDQILSREIDDFFRAVNDISDVKNDPAYQSTNDSAVKLIAGFREESTDSMKNKKFIQDSLSGKTNDNGQRKGKMQNREEKSCIDADRISSLWVDDWNKKKENNNLNDPETKERREFISASLYENKNKSGRKIFSIRPSIIKYASLAAAVIAGAFLLIRSFLPDYDNNDLFNKYYKPFAAVSALTRGSEERLFDVFNTAVENYRTGNYQAASVLFSKTMLNKQLSDPSKFFLGLTEIELNNPGRAVELLETVANTPGIYSGDATWYLGLACLKTGDRDKAGQSFMILSQENGFYSEPSMKILRRLK